MRNLGTTHAKFDIITDHKALIWLLNLPPTQSSNSRLCRWSFNAGSYDFNVIHKSGKFHLNADTVSRLLLSLAKENVNDDKDDDIEDNYMRTFIHCTI